MRPLRRRWPEGTWMRLRSGVLLRELMTTKHLSNADLGLHAEVARTFISALVNGRRTSCKPRTAERISERLEVPLELLFEPRASADSGSRRKRGMKEVDAA